METAAKQFYNHSSFTATYYALYIALERWVADNVFRQDLSRVFLASDEYSYRRRFELVDPSSRYDSIQASTLQFPFCNYWPGNSGWVPDQRPSTNQASLLFFGASANSRMLKAMAVTTDIGMTFHFDREDDCRLAYELLLYSSFREQWMYTPIAWREEVLKIPLYFKIQDLSFNPTFTENDWLKQNRIFTITARFELRSFIVKQLTQPIYSSDGPIIDNEERYTLTEEVIAYFYTGKKLQPTLTLGSIFDYNPTIIINQCGATETTFTTATLGWDITSTETLTGITVAIPGRAPISLAPTETSLLISNLIDGSSYTATITFATANNSKVVQIQFATPIQPPSVGGGKASDKKSLVGTTW